MDSANGGGCGKAANGASNGADDQPIKRFTPPGLIEYKPDTELIFPPALRKHDFKPLAFGNKKKRWYRPVTLKQLLEIKKANKSAKIIGGSTETHIEGKTISKACDLVLIDSVISQIQGNELYRICLCWRHSRTTPISLP